MSDQDKKETVRIIRVYSAIDETVITSMLESAGIEPLSDATNFHRVQYGTLFSPETGITVSVANDDAAEAREIARDFIENHRERARKDPSDRRMALPPEQLS